MTETHRERLERAVRGTRPPSATVAELAQAVVAWAADALPPREGTHESDNLRLAMREAVELYGDIDCRHFGALQLEASRALMIERGLSRRVINARVKRIRYCFRFAVRRGWAPSALIEELKSVPVLVPLRSAAPDRPEVEDVPLEYVEATCQHLPHMLATMIRVQLETGMRPGELCRMLGEEIDTTGATWVYRPKKHKNAWRGHTREIQLGPRAVDLLAPYYHAYGPIFWSCHGTSYRQNSYYNAIAKAAKKAGVPVWGPNRLRHTAATSIEQTHGYEAAQAILGHRTASQTERYAHARNKTAQRIALERG